MMLSVLMLFGMLTALFVYGMFDTSSLSLQRDKDTARAFAEVKRALIGWSAQRNPPPWNPASSARPGELPCPDINPLDGFEDGNCSAGAIGRVPWKTLGIPEPKDGTGETLWYAIAGPFRIFNVNTEPIHSDTKGNITVYQNSTASAVTTEAIAVLFAPGLVLGTQNRDTVATALCPTTGTTIAKNLCAANYLETAAGVNNATPNTNTTPPSFISAQGLATFNDKVMAITTSDLMPLVEQRVARELRAVLVDYKAKVGVYPWADCSSGDSDYGENKGRIPWPAALPQPWGYNGSLTLPNWFTNRGTTCANPLPNTCYNWAWVIHYAVGRNFLEDPAGCTMCEVGQTSLSVNGAWNKEVVIIMSGPAGTSRPGVPYVGEIVGPWPPPPPPAYWVPGNCEPVLPYSAWQAYLEDSENNDYAANDRFVTPSSTVYARDRIFTIP